MLAIVPYVHRKPFERRHDCFYCGGATFYIPEDDHYAQFRTVSYRYTHDHIFPKHLRRRGIDTKTVPACQRCNQRKGQMRPGEFIALKISKQRWPLIDWNAIVRTHGACYNHIGWVYGRPLVLLKIESTSTTLFS